MAENLAKRQTELSSGHKMRFQGGDKTEDEKPKEHFADHSQPGESPEGGEQRVLMVDASRSVERGHTSVKRGHWGRPRGAKSKRTLKRQEERESRESYAAAFEALSQRPPVDERSLVEMGDEMLELHTLSLHNHCYLMQHMVLLSALSSRFQSSNSRCLVDVEGAWESREEERRAAVSIVRRGLFLVQPLNSTSP